MSSDSSTPYTIQWEHFAAVDLRIGTIVSVDPFPEARKPALKLTIDFGPDLGTRRSSAQVTHYDPSRLLGRQVVCVLNFPPKQIAGFRSEVLVLGAPMADGAVSLLHPDTQVPDGGRIF